MSVPLSVSLVMLHNIDHPCNPVEMYSRNLSRGCIDLIVHGFSFLNLFIYFILFLNTIKGSGGKCAEILCAFFSVVSYPI